MDKKNTSYLIFAATTIDILHILKYTLSNFFPLEKDKLIRKNKIILCIFQILVFKKSQ